MRHKYIVLDTETGGVESQENPITEIALIGLDGEKFEEIGRFETLVKPYNDLEVTKGALQATGMKMADINKGMDSGELVHILKEFFKRNTTGKGKWTFKPVIVGHNISFDMAFLIELFFFHDEWIGDYLASNGTAITTMDTLQLSMHRWPKLPKSGDSSYKLGSCCERAGITLNNAHRAMSDTIATTELFKYLMMSMRGGTVTNTNTKTNTTDIVEEKSRAKFNF